VTTDDGLDPATAYMTEVIRERNVAEAKLTAISTRLSYLLGYWGESGTVPVAEVRAVLEMCQPPDES
jgi:hypothetical protein